MATFAGTIDSTSLEEKDAPTVMIVGKSGMGKSTLGNYLLYGSSKPEGGFTTGWGTEPETTKCSSKFVVSTPAPSFLPSSTEEAGGPLRVIDTPGIPDPKNRTLDFYDEVVLTARGSEGLNAFIIAIFCPKDRGQISKDFETYRVLLAQFTRLPCLKIILCRVKLTPDQKPEQKKDELDNVKRWVETIRTRAGLEGADIYYLFEDDEQTTQLFILRQTICKVPKVPIPYWSIRTHSELMASVGKLTELSTRREALENEKTRLNKEKAQLEGLNPTLETCISITKGVAPYLPSAIIGVGALTEVGAGFAFCGGIAELSAMAAGAAKIGTKALSTVLDNMVENNKRHATKAGNEVAAIEKELENGIDEAALQRDQKTLEELYRVANITTTTEPS